MRKLWKAGVLLLVATFAFCGCNNSKKAEEATTEAKEEKIEVDYGLGLTDDGMLDGIDPEEYVTVCDYNEIEIPEKEVEVTEEAVKGQITPILQNYGIYEGEIKKGDTVNIDYVGKVNGEAFEGGAASDQLLEIGSHTFIDGFEEQLIGHMPGEDPFDIQVTFPEQYGSTDLAGKDAVFTVTINYILPELNDDFVEKNFSEDLGISTVEEFKDQVRENLREKNQNDYIWEYLIANSEFHSLPEKLMEKRLDVALDSLRLNYFYYGYRDEQIMQMYNVDSMEEVREQLRSDTENSVKTYLISNYIAGKENLAVDEQAIDHYIGKDNVDGYYEQFGKSYVKAQILVSMIADYITENATLK